MVPVEELWALIGNRKNVPLDSLGKLIVSTLQEEEDEVEGNDNEADDTLGEYDNDMDEAPADDSDVD